MKIEPLKWDGTKAKSVQGRSFVVVRPLQGTYWNAYLDSKSTRLKLGRFISIHMAMEYCEETHRRLVREHWYDGPITRS